MKKIFLLLSIIALILTACVNKTELPWDNGPLTISKNGRYLMHENGEAFFWLGNTGWLMPEKLSREEVVTFLDKCQEAEYNVIQVQTLNNVPSINYYGKSSHPQDYDFSNVDDDGEDGYWKHMDYIIDQAASRGIYIGMVCIWGELVNKGLMNEDEAVKYGSFLAERYKNSPNIIWIIGGDTRGDNKTEIWDTLAETIKNIDKNHLMSFHPRGRTQSATWFHNRDWLDFNMFQSGHRSYFQIRNDKDDALAPIAEDNWRYVDAAIKMSPPKPVLDAEPSYEDIPHGLHDPKAPRWQAADVRRYAYWSVFAGACGHTYGHNSIMQMLKPGDKNISYFADKYWFDALNDDGFNQMKYLKKLILTFPYFERRPAQETLINNNGIRYERLSATCGKDYILVYDYLSIPINVDTDKITGKNKNAWWFSPSDGTLKYIDKTKSGITEYIPETQNDIVLIITDSRKNYIKKDQTNL